MKRRHLILAACLAVAGWLALIPGKTPSSAVVGAVTREVPATAVRANLRDHTSTPLVPVSPTILEIVSRETLIGGARAEAPGTGVFGSQSWSPPPPPTPEEKPVPPPRPPPPNAPPLPFVYLGKKLEDGKWEVYLSRGDNVVIARAHTALDDTYRTEAIAPPLLSLTYLPLQQTQTIAIGGAD